MGRRVTQAEADRILDLYSTTGNARQIVEATGRSWSVIKHLAAAARKNGDPRGTPPATRGRGRGFSIAENRRLRDLAEQGASIRAIAKALGCHPDTAARKVRSLGIDARWVEAAPLVIPEPEPVPQPRADIVVRRIRHVPLDRGATASFVDVSLPRITLIDGAAAG